MSAAADRPIRLRLGTRVAVLGSLLVIAVWLAATWDWVRDQQASLEARPAELESRLRESLVSTVWERLAAPPLSLEQALVAARAREAELLALRESRRGRRVVDPPNLVELTRQQLEVAFRDLGLVDGAWLRDATGIRWAPAFLAQGLGEGPIDGACLLRTEDDDWALGRCLERELRTGAGGVIAGAARAIDLSDVPGIRELAMPPGGDDAVMVAIPAGTASWAIVLKGDHDRLLAKADGWPERLEVVSRDAPEWAIHQVYRNAAFKVSRQEAWPLPGLELLLATSPAEELAWPDLLRGDAGSLSRSWQKRVQRTGSIALAALLFFAFLGWRINSAFRPVVAAARSLGAENLDVQVPIRRSDEIGALAAVLNDLGTSLKHARRNWEREAKLAAWRDVARGLAHEIKNPLTPIRGTVENLLRWRDEEPERFDEKVESRLGTILEEVEQLSRLASAFSDFAKLPLPQLEPADLNVLLRDVIALQLGDREGLSVDDRLDAKLAPVNLDGGQIRQVVTNLMKNAREALGEGGGVVRVESGRHGSGAWFAVSDDGPGVDEGSLDQLFVPGWSTRKHEGGSGLGLWLCHRIVLEHGGTIEASRSELGGLRVRVTLPEG